MKILIFFDLVNTKLLNIYKSKKEHELSSIISQLKIKYSNKSPVFKIYCINKTLYHLRQNKFNPSIISILSENLNVDRRKYKQLLETAWQRIIELYNNLVKTDFDSLKYFLIILEAEIKYYLYDIVERVEYIKSIISREHPDLIILLQRNNDYFNVFSYNEDIEKDKLKLVKSNLDDKFSIISRRYEFLTRLILDANHLIKSIFKQKKNFSKPNSTKSNVVGLVLPRFYHLRGFDPVYKELKKRNIATNLLVPNFFQFGPNLKDFLFKYLGFLNLKLKLRKLFNDSKVKKKIIQYIDNPWKNVFYNLVYNLFLNSIIKIIFWHKKIEQELKRLDYKLFIFCNEYFSEIRTLVFICKKDLIKTCFLPYVGIPNNVTHTTPYYSDIIYVDGILDKEFLVKNSVNPEKIIISGSVRHENLFKEIPKLLSIKDTFSGKIYHLDQDRIKILLTTSPISIESNKYFLKTVVNSLRRLSNIQFIIKLHPRESGLNHKKLLEDMGYADVIIVKDVDLYKLLKSCDFLLTKDSGIILEAMAVGIPIICLDLMNLRLFFSGEFLFSNKNYVLKAYNENDIYNYLQSFIMNPKKLEDYKKQTKENLKSFLFNKVGYSPTNRITSDIIKLLRNEKF